MTAAVLPACRTWRYRLDRNIHMFGRFTLGFCLHNPSTADEARDDPTVRRCMGFATKLDAARIVIVNVWAGRATDPADLWSMPDPIGPENDRYIAEVAAEVAASGGYMLAGWGSIAPPSAFRPEALQRLGEVERVIRETPCSIRHLGINKDGTPKHPLYLPSDTWPQVLPSNRAAGVRRSARRPDRRSAAPSISRGRRHIGGATP